MTGGEPNLFFPNLWDVTNFLVSTPKAGEDEDEVGAVGIYRLEAESMSKKEKRIRLSL